MWRRNCTLLVGTLLAVGIVVLSRHHPVTAEASTLTAGPQPVGNSTLHPYRSPQDLVLSPDGRVIAVCDRTARVLQFVNADSGKIFGESALNGTPGQIAWSADGSRVFTPEYEGGCIAEVRAADAYVLRHIPAGPSPRAVALAHKRGLLLIGDVAPPQLLVRRLGAGGDPDWPVGFDGE